MRYHYKKPPVYASLYGNTYNCNHPVYNECTLFKINDKGLAIIQQRFDKSTKCTWWGEIDPWLTDTLYLYPGFKEYFDSRSESYQNGLYPTVTIRQIMWALKIKPIKKKDGKRVSIEEIYRFAKFSSPITERRQNK